MVESTRKAIIGSSSIEIHLKKNIEVTSDVVSDLPQLPTTDPWLVLNYDMNADNWLNANTFTNFPDADQEFINRTQGQGITNVGRLEAGKSGQREIQE